MGHQTCRSSILFDDARNRLTRLLNFFDIKTKEQKAASYSRLHQNDDLNALLAKATLSARNKNNMTIDIGQNNLISNKPIFNPEGYSIQHQIVIDDDSHLKYWTDAELRTIILTMCPNVVNTPLFDLNALSNSQYLTAVTRAIQNTDYNKSWCAANCQSYWCRSIILRELGGREQVWAFSDPEEAMLFKLIMQ